MGCQVCFVFLKLLAGVCSALSYLSWYCSDGLGEAYDGDIAFASALESFGGGHDDPISVAVGGIFSALL